MEGEGIPLEKLQNQKYRDVLSIRLYYDWHTYVFSFLVLVTSFDSSCSDTLMEECVRAMQQSLREAVPVKKRVKSVYNQRNLGTIKERKKVKKDEKEVSSGEVILRILRMRWAPQVPLRILQRVLTKSRKDQTHKSSSLSSLR